MKPLFDENLSPNLVPKIGNAGSREIVNLLRIRYLPIAEFGAAGQESVLILS